MGMTEIFACVVLAWAVFTVTVPLLEDWVIHRNR